MNVSEKYPDLHHRGYFKYLLPLKPLQIFKKMHYKLRSHKLNCQQTYCIKCNLTYSINDDVNHEEKQLIILFYVLILS